MTDLPDSPSNALADLLERCGKTRPEAEALAAEMVQRQRAVDPACSYLGFRFHSTSAGC